jgi:flagellar motor switch protein FliN/FliY
MGMEAKKTPGIQFLDQWAAEFTTAVRMFTSQDPAVTCVAYDAAEKPFDTSASYVWWKQDLELDGWHSLWIGSPEATWSALGAAMASSPEGSRDIYLEMLTQSLQGAAHVASAGLPTAIVCGRGVVDGPPSAAGMETVEVKISLAGKALPSMLAVVPADMFGDTSEELPDADAPRRMIAQEINSDYNLALIDRLIDLELPLYVALGRAVLPIRDVLRLSAGSLVELDRKLGDSVEIIVHGTVVALGEVVSVKGNYGVRVREIMSRQDRYALQSKGERAALAGATH